MSPDIAAIILTQASLAKRRAGPNTSLLAQLTFREGEIFNLLASGLTNREIGQRLGVTESTIKRYFTRIFEKLHVRNRVEAAMLLEKPPDFPWHAGEQTEHNRRRASDLHAASWGWRRSDHQPVQLSASGLVGSM